VVHVAAVPAGYPVISENPTWKTIQKDANATLTCSATGLPTPTVSWLKNFVPLDVSNARISVLPSGIALVSILLFSSRSRRSAVFTVVVDI